MSDYPSEVVQRVVYERDPEGWLKQRAALYNGHLSGFAESISERFTGEIRERLDATFDLIVFATYNLRIPDRDLPVGEVKLVYEVGETISGMRGSGFFVRRSFDRWAKDLNLLEKRVTKTLRKYDLIDEYENPERYLFSVADWLEHER